MLMANTLAYDDAESIALVKSFKGLLPGIAQKPVMSINSQCRNKLECLSLTFYFILVQYLQA